MDCFAGVRIDRCPVPLADTRPGDGHPGVGLIDGQAEVPEEGAVSLGGQVQEAVEGEDLDVCLIGFVVAEVAEAILGNAEICLLAAPLSQPAGSFPGISEGASASGAGADARTCRPATYRPGSGPDSEHAAEYRVRPPRPGAPSSSRMTRFRPWPAVAVTALSSSTATPTFSTPSTSRTARSRRSTSP